MRAALARVAERLGTAGQFAGQGGDMIDDALAALTQLSEQHSESLVPAGAAPGGRRGEPRRPAHPARGTALADIEARL